LWIREIQLIPFGEIDPQILKILADEVKRVFSIKTVIKDPLPLPDDAFNQKRGQFLASKLIKALPRNEISLGITDRDLYAPSLNFVFGQALLGMKVAVVSLARLDNSFYGLSPDEELFFERAKKEILHELGHAIGLSHCSKDCVMKFSNSILEVDKKPKDFCPSCRASLNIILTKGGKNE